MGSSFLSDAGRQTSCHKTIESEHGWEAFEQIAEGYPAFELIAL
jgi:hypothetical protein